jgi:hypothetical protein
MRYLQYLLIPALGASLSLSWACGSTGGNEFDGGTNPDGAAPNEDGSSLDPDGTFNPPDGGDQGSDVSCGVVKAEAELAKVNLVVMVDRSGSMGDTAEDPSFNPALRWIPVTTALKGFFSDPTSVNLQASLSYFPAKTRDAQCTAASYLTPDVPRTALPSPLFAASINATGPKLDTPTLLAMQGAVAQAEAIALAHPTEKTAIVFATDGEPVECGVPWNDANLRQQALAKTASAAGAIAARIPTYVIGVGPSVAGLNQVAQAGGTANVITVDVGNPALTTQQLQAALAAIRGKLIDCDFAIPVPADGRNVDVNKIGVTFTDGAGVVKKIAYDANCAGEGFKFDNPAAPKKVVLCTNSCNAVRADAKGRIDVLFTCERQQIVVPN